MKFDDIHSKILAKIYDGGRVFEKVLWIGDPGIKNYDALSIFFDGKNIKKLPKDVNEIFELLGAKEVTVIWQDFKNNNFNFKLDFDNEYDLVINSSESAHVFDQHSFFRNIHDAAATNAVMVHVVPHFNVGDRGLWTYQPNMFAKLCGENDYKMRHSYMATAQNNHIEEDFVRINIEYDYAGDRYMSDAKYQMWLCPAYIVVSLLKENANEFKGYV